MNNKATAQAITDAIAALDRLITQLEAQLKAVNDGS